MICDNNYLRAFEVALKSFFCHHDNVNVFLITNEKLELNFLYLDEILKRKKSKLTVINIDKYIEKENDRHISKATYLRYFIPELFKYSVSNRWVYLDCDIVVNGNVEEVFEKEAFLLYPLLAVDECYNEFAYMTFNAGVLFINSDLWKTTERELFEYNTKNIHLNDQNVLNDFFRGKWYPIEHSYNFQEGDMFFFEKLFENGVESNLKEIKIFHWSSGRKPFNEKTYFYEIWHFFNDLKWEKILNYNKNIGGV